MPLLQQLSKIQERVVPLWDLHAFLLIRGNRGHHELLKVLEYKSLIKVIEQKESISIDALEYEI